MKRCLILCLVFLLKVDIPVSSAAVQSLIEGSSSSIEHGWEVGWSLAAYGNAHQSFINTKRRQVCCFLHLALVMCNHENL